MWPGLEALPWRWAGGAALGLGLALEALALLVRGWWRRRRAPRREVLFFPSPVTCTAALLGEPGPAPCLCPLPHGDSPLARLLRRLLSARRSLELCLFAFSSPQLGRAVQLLHRRGVRLPVLADCSPHFAGIQVRHDQESGYMHHKFAIVDKKMLITGSLNWTTQAIQNNRENVLIVEDAEYVEPFLAEFERIWEEYNPANYTFFPTEKEQK
uniref:Mitochondrial cardiolipin hydrolase n=1 Tax=Chrysemys picta bellii TaxID=8478 RepID=A0A8C3I7P1_CHRPI